jgi:hypothetical protein
MSRLIYSADDYFQSYSGKLFCNYLPDRCDKRKLVEASYLNQLRQRQIIKPWQLIKYRFYVDLVFFNAPP